jgi:hypothetical protein
VLLRQSLTATATGRIDSQEGTVGSQIVEFTDGMKFGLGYNRLTGDVLPSPAVVGSTSAVAGAAGQQAAIDCVTVQDVESLHKSLGVSVDAGGSYMGFSGSAKVDYIHSCDFSSFSTYVIVRVSVQDAFESIDAPEFHPDAVDLLKVGNPDRFRARFGDSYIAGIRKGGEYFAIYQLTGSDQSEKEKLAVSVHAAFDDLAASAHLNSTIDSATSSSKSHLEVQIHVFRQGSISIADLSVEDIMATARQFPVAVSGGNAFPYAVQLQDYAGLKNPNDKFNYYDIKNQQDVLEDLAKKRFEFLALRDDLKYILKHSDDFANSDGSPVDRDALSKSFDDVVNQINTMQTEAAACSRDAGQCKFTTFDTSKFKLPEIAKKLGGIPVVSLVGLRVHPVNKALNEPLTEYSQFQAEVLAEAEPGSKGVLPSEVQFNFIMSGVKITFDKPVSVTGGWLFWIIEQQPASGDVGTGAEVLLKVQGGLRPPPGITPV